MRTLVTGGTGTLGTACLAAVRSAGSEVIGASRHREPTADDLDWHHLDVRDREGVRRAVERVRPEVIIHTAYVQDDWMTTATGAANVALAADLAAALLEIGSSHRSGIHHVAGADALSRHELAVLIARRDGTDPGS